MGQGGGIYHSAGHFAGSRGGSWALCPVAPATCAVCPQAAVGGAPGRPRGAGEGGAAAGPGSPREGGAAVPGPQWRGRLPLPHRCRRGAPHRHVARRRPAPCAAGGAVGAFLRAHEPRAALTSAPRCRGRPPGWPSPRGGPIRPGRWSISQDTHACLSPAPVGLQDDPSHLPVPSLHPFLWWKAVGGILGVKGVSQDTQTCIGLDPTQRLALSITSTSTAWGHGGKEDKVVPGQAPGG